jgi:site-specific DNA recombinase
MTRPRSRHPMPASPRVRCAVYTRKSTEEGLDQEFNTLFAQRESGEAYIKSQVPELSQIF